MAAELWRHNSRAARCRYRAIWRLPVSGSSCPSLRMSTYYVSIWGIISFLHFYRRVQKSVVLVLIWWECSAAYNIWIFSFRGEGKKSFINVGLSLPSPHIIMRGGFKRTATFDYIFPLSLLSQYLLLGLRALARAGFLHLPLLDCSQSLSYFVLSQAKLAQLPIPHVSKQLPRASLRVKGVLPTKIDVCTSVFTIQAVATAL